MIGFTQTVQVAVIMSTIAFFGIGGSGYVSAIGFIDAGCRYSRDQYTLYSG